MIVSQEHIGKIIHLNSGACFQVNEVTDRHVTALWEDGRERQMSCHVNGSVEEDATRIAAFHRSLALAKALNAAEQAAHRHMERGNPIEQRNAARVLDIIEEHKNARERGPAEKDSLDARLTSAKERASHRNSNPEPPKEQIR